MRRFETAKRTLGSIAVALGAGVAAAQKSILELVPGYDKLPIESRNLFLIVTTFVVVVVFIYMLYRFLLYLVDRSRLFRSLLAGSDHIECTWVNFVCDTEKEAVITGGLLQVFYKDGRFRVEGESFHRDGKSGGFFRSTMAAYSEDEHTLSFGFDVELDAQGLREKAGLARYSFHTDGRKPPKFFWGHFYVNGETARRIVYGQRLAWLQSRRLARGDLATRGQRVAKFIEENEFRVLRPSLASGAQAGSGPKTATQPSAPGAASA